MAVRLESMHGRAAFVTGGASGIGLGIAEAIGRAGGKVMIADIQPDAISSAVQTLREKGITAQGVVCDVSLRSSVEKAAEAALDVYGTLDLVCNNAGVVFEMAAHDWTDSGWNWVLGVNVMGMVHGVQTFRPIFNRQSNGGYFVNTGSIASHCGRRNTSQYTASKFAILGLSQSLQEELAPENIGVSVICPGAVMTNILSSTRNAPQDVRDRMEKAPPNLAAVDIGTPPPPGMRYMTEPVEVGEMLLASIARGDFYIFTDLTWAEDLEERARWVRTGYDRLRAWEKARGR